MQLATSTSSVMGEERRIEGQGPRKSTATGLSAYNHGLTVSKEKRDDSLNMVRKSTQ